MSRKGFGVAVGSGMVATEEEEEEQFDQLITDDGHPSSTRPRQPDPSVTRPRVHHDCRVRRVRATPRESLELPFRGREYRDDGFKFPGPSNGRDRVPHKSLT